MKTEEAKGNERSKLYDGLRLLPVILFISVTPLIVHALPYSLPLSDLPWISGEDDTVLWDVFSYCKLRFIVGVTVLSVIVFVFLLIWGRLRIKRTPVYIPMAAYTVSVLISFFLSGYKEIAWLGGMERFEGTLVILCYMVMLFYTIQAVQDIKDAGVILVFLAATVLIECIIGITQLAGCDLLFMEPVKRLIATGMEIEPSFASGQVYQTVANMNYVSFWLCPVIPLLVLGFVRGIMQKSEPQGNKDSAERRLQKMIPVICAILLGLAAVNCIGAGSVGGITGMALSCTGIIILLIPKKPVRAVIAAGFIVLYIAAICFAFRTGDAISIDHLKTGPDRLEMSLDGELLTAVMEEPGYFTFYGRSGEPLDSTPDEDRAELYYILGGEGINKIAVETYDIDREYYLLVHFPTDSLLFHFGENGVTFCNPYGYEVELDKTEYFGFKNHFGFATGRGYIWAASLPLIAEHPLFGTGADTFMMAFPQTDYAGKVSSGGKASMIPDKAHNMYLQMAVTTGLLSLAAFIAMMAVVYAGVIKAGAFRMESSKDGTMPALSRERVLIWGVTLGIAGFLFAALWCDSTVSVMPVFYGLLGILISLGTKR